MISTDIFALSNSKAFEQCALETFQHQAKCNLVYAEFLRHLKVNPSQITTIHNIPFLPISLFKSHKIVTEDIENPQLFLSSGTTGSASKHYVNDLSLYEQSYLKAFEIFYGDIEEYVVLALLPSYLERNGSSLVYMTDDLIKRSKSSDSGFYLNNLDQLAKKLDVLNKTSQKILLIGVSYALIDLVTKYTFQLKNTIVMETGGMKGRRKELTRLELHDILSRGFGVSTIHSEYGMTELLSQAYSKGNGLFETPPWMKILIRDAEDATQYINFGQTGGVNIIDLANINSCSFIATQDLGKVYANGSFDILGRFDHADIRGCNLLTS